MIGFDTNVLVRLLVNDDTAQAQAVRELLEPINDTPEAVLLSDLVIVETLWVLKGRYGQDRAALAGVVDLLLSVKTFAFEDRPTLEQAVTAFRSGKAGFADCLIAVRNRRLGCEHTVSFDKALARQPGVRLLAASR
ncbi:PIN domain-containing protein [Comamonas badia]|uniref:PIN domain-containing protein n=1 Tax=Comamonas badia TaxID=265291 RepID=UPI00040E215E|nr:type II toxin-antitoxin system VapC family toxin [Comamonas badia]